MNFTFHEVTNLFLECNAHLESLECKGHCIPKIFRRAGGLRFCSVRVVSSTGGVWCLPPEEARVPLLRRRLRLLSTNIKLSPFLIMYDERRVDFSSPCLCRIKSAVLNVWMFWYSASGGAAGVTSRLVPLPSLFLREEWRPTRRQTFSMNPYLLSSHYYFRLRCNSNTRCNRSLRTHMDFITHSHLHTQKQCFPGEGVYWYHSQKVFHFDKNESQVRSAVPCHCPGVNVTIFRFLQTISDF